MLVPTTHTPRPALFSRPASSEFKPIEWTPIDETRTIPSGYTLNGPFGTLEIPQSRAATVGRRHENDLSISAPDVSRQHAAIRYRGGKIEVCDLGSTCGTTVNGKRVPARQWVGVPDGAQVGFASTSFDLSSASLSCQAVARGLEEMNLPVDVLQTYLKEVADARQPVFSRTQLQALVEKVVSRQRDSDSAAAFDLNLAELY